MEKRTKFITGLTAGAFIGAAAGLLMAPKTGKESRQVVGQRATVIRQKAGGYVGKLRRRGTQQIEEIETSVNDHVGVSS